MATSAAMGNISMENDRSVRHDTIDKDSERCVTSSIGHARYAVTRRTCPATCVISQQNIDTHNLHITRYSVIPLLHCVRRHQQMCDDSILT